MYLVGLCYKLGTENNQTQVKKIVERSVLICKCAKYWNQLPTTERNVYRELYNFIYRYRPTDRYIQKNSEWLNSTVIFKRT